MKVGLQISSFTWPGGAAQLGPTLARVVRTAEDVGFDSIWVMDHFFQIRSIGREEEPMLEGMTALGWMAALTHRARLGLMVGGVHYRHPGLWVKATTTLDVLSGGRAWLGIGAAWNESESRALGFPFPPLGVRFELLEDTLRIARGMWQGEHGSEERLEGRHYLATRLLSSPQSLSRPRVPILIGGGGEQKTLRLVAQYADATNVFGDGPPGSPTSTPSCASTASGWGATSTRSSGRPTRTSTSARMGATPSAGRSGAAGASHRPRSSTALASWPTPAPST